ncbi:DoxX-like family protein [Acinetobacter sp. WCHAc060042]|uniref:DoxX-like family protein n=1 Tax=Acinetobacter sp. WCHAc060042 TaxID=2213016 RepID=UPI000DA68637|nr:DoxX-like family protein [Acinetobacter sp. WCHAc060042]
MNNNPLLKFINLSLSFLWGYQGLIPKILFINPDEIAIWQTFGFSYAQAQLAGQLSGVLECVFALLLLFSSSKYLHYLSIFSLVFLFALVTFLIPDSLVRAFNPVVMNIAMISLSVCYCMLRNQETASFSTQNKGSI